MTRFAPLLAAALLSACAVHPAYQRPAIDLPDRLDRATPQATLATAVPEAWWSVYRDPALDALMSEALAHNADVHIAAARLEEARARAGIADADRSPTVDATLGSARTRSSLEGIATTPRTLNVHSVGLGARYEIDLWARYRNASAAARAELLAADAARQTVALALSADVARQYFALQAADARVDIATRTLASRRDASDLLGQRVAAGSAAEIDALNADAAARAVAAELAAARNAQQATEATLAVLLGRSPRAIVDATVFRARHSAAPVLVPDALPAELLRRRPDLVEAEQALVAAHARIGEARAQRLPAIALTASLGRESTDFATLLDGSAGMFSLALGLTQPIWDAGRLKHAQDAAEARAAQARARYVQAVANAFADVRRALAAQRAAMDSRDAQAARVEALDRALSHARLRFDAGLVGRLEVLDTERNLLDAQLRLADASAAQKSAIADLFRALGGGWAPPQ